MYRVSFTQQDYDFCQGPLRSPQWRPRRHPLAGRNGSRQAPIRTAGTLPYARAVRWLPRCHTPRLGIVRCDSRRRLSTLRGRAVRPKSVYTWRLTVTNPISRDPVQSPSTLRAPRVDCERVAAAHWATPGLRTKRNSSRSAADLETGYAFQRRYRDFSPRLSCDIRGARWRGAGARPRCATAGPGQPSPGWRRIRLRPLAGDRERRAPPQR